MKVIVAGSALRALVAGVLIAAGIASAFGQSATAGRDLELLSAAERGDAAMVRTLLDMGADVQRIDAAGNTALIRAAELGHVDAVRALLKSKVNLNHVNRSGRTALLAAITAGDGTPRFGQIVLLLSAAGTDVNIADRNKLTPLDHARRSGYAAMVSVLEHAGAR